MMNIESQVREDFNRVRKFAFISKLLHLFSPITQELLSLQELKTALRSRGEAYIGMQTIPIQNIIGSEGRYKDFTKHFFPRYEHLRHRWQNIDRAHHKNIILPPIKLYKLGEMYIVRDGNHRVSVARAQKVHAIDAEVTVLQTEIPVSEKITRSTLRPLVIEHERKELFHQFPLSRIAPDHSFRVTLINNYPQIGQHILGHKYYMNESQEKEISMYQAAQHWYTTVYKPTIDIIRKYRIISRFNGKTETDLYLWILQHWDELKTKYGNHYSLVTAAVSYSHTFGKSTLNRLFSRLKYAREST